MTLFLLQTSCVFKTGGNDDDVSASNQFASEFIENDDDVSASNQLCF